MLQLTVHLVAEAQLHPHVGQPRALLLAGQAPLEWWEGIRVLLPLT
ncbi:MAG TPA: hypothetical protein VI094_14815 [Propionibacteriaceae bacterium]